MISAGETKPITQRINCTTATSGISCPGDEGAKKSSGTLVEIAVPAVEVPLNNREGVNLGVGLDVGVGQIATYLSDKAGDMSTYQDVYIGYRRMIFDSGNSFRLGYKFPSYNLGFVGNLALRMPFSVSVAYSRAKAEADKTVSTTEYVEAHTPIGMPPQYESVAGPDKTVREPVDTSAYSGRFLVHLDALPYGHDSSIGLGLYFGPELGYGKKDGDGIFQYGVVLGAGLKIGIF